MSIRNIPFRKVMRTTSFRLTLIFMGMFVFFAGALILFLSWNSRQAYHTEIQKNINAEAIGLAEAYRAGRLPFLIRAANGRGSRPDAPIILVVDRNGRKLAGNISNIDSKFLLANEAVIMPYRRTIVDLSALRRPPRKDAQRPLLPRRQLRNERNEKGAPRPKKRDERIPRPSPNDEAEEEEADSSDENLRPLLNFRIARPGKKQSSIEDNDDGKDEDDEPEIQDREALVQVFRVRNGVRVLIGRDLGGRKVFLGVLRQALLLTGAMALLMGLVGGLFISKRVLSRVEGVTATANRIMAGDLSERMMVKGSGDEFDGLSTSLNNMLDRLELLMRGMKEVSDNIAHDLKTPLTRMRTRIETALRAGNKDQEHISALEVAVEDADQLISTFNALLHIARLEAGNTALEIGEIDISMIAADVVELYEPSAEDAGLPMNINISPNLKARGNRELIAQAMSNILDNAIKYGSQKDDTEAGTIEVLVHAVGKNINISIADKGMGIPDEEHDRVLERFVRLEKSRTSPGNGLGLSLVRAIMGIHKGDVTLADNKPGLKVTLIFPTL